MASDQGLNLLGKEGEGDGCEVGGLGETGRDTGQHIRRRKKKKPAIGRPTRKSGAKPRGQQDAKRMREKQSRIVRVEQALRQLTNPFNHMSLDKKKDMALFLYHRRLQVAIAAGDSFFPSRARIIVYVASEVGVSECSLRRWLKTFEELGVMTTSRRGQHAKTVSPIVEPDFRAQFISHVKSESCRKGQPHLTTSALAKWVNSELELEEDDRYSEECVRLWLHECGFKVKESKKGVYVDGHEREDVVRDRQERFLPEMERILEECVGVRQDENGAISIVNEDAKFILVSVDQKAHKSNERPLCFWGDDEMTALLPKGEGKLVMTSDFVSVFGLLKLNEEQFQPVLERMLATDREATEALLKSKGEERMRRGGRLLDVSKSGYYNTELCLEDFENAVDMVDVAFDGKYTPIFLIDNSPIHKTKPDDALNARTMNVKDGGKQPLMRPGFFRKDPLKITQHMVYQDGEKKGIAKGLKTVIGERYGDEAVKEENILGKKHDELVEILEAEEDFQDSSTLLEERMAEMGARVVLLPKFHPEFNPIEDISRWCRDRNIVGSSHGFLERVLSADEVITAERCQKYFISCQRFMDAYREGATGNTVLAKTREMKKSHRVPLMIDKQPRVSYDRSRGRRIVMDLESDRRGAEGDTDGDEVVFDQESFASKMRQHLFRTGNPRFRLAKLGNDARVHGREAPSSDLADWMVGKHFFDQIVEKQRQDDALMGGAMEEEEWRTIWREERAEEMRERPEE